MSWVIQGGGIFAEDLSMPAAGVLSQRQCETLVGDANRAEKLVAALAALAETWELQQAAYPDDYAAAAVRLCARELRAIPAILEVSE